MTDPFILAQRIDGVATITINRPDRRNALNRDAKEQLREALEGVGRDSTVRAVVLIGAGNNFCVGQDLAEHADALRADPSTAFETVEAHYLPIVASIATMPKPVIAAVNGTCVGAGLGFALACDFMVFSRSATLATAFSAIGLTCDSGLSWTLPRAVGHTRATELILLGESFTPDDLIRWGVACKVVDPEDVAIAAHELAVRLAIGPTAAYAESKRLMAEASSQSLRVSMFLEVSAQSRCGTTTDHSTAVEAFMCRETPAFQGR